MIELPEVLTIARQMNSDLRGKRIASAMRGNSPHKFAFYNRPPEEYAAILKGKTIGEATDHGGCLLVSAEPDYVLMLAGGGERILYHADSKTLPAKHQLLLHFADDTYLAVTVQGWGYAQLWGRSEEGSPTGKGGVPTLSAAFSPEYFQGLFEALPDGDGRNIKFFVISQPGVWGVANGYLQDILFRAKIHPRRRAADLTPEERSRLYDAIKETLTQAVALGGRDTERDLYDRPGGYRRILDSRTVGHPCPRCGTPIEKIMFMGGASYFCPRCQV